jgi:hypothetical protein
MSCRYIDNPDIYEDYIFERLGVLEKEEFKEHLKECPDCQKELEKQRSLIIALREIGKEEMKREIKAQAENWASRGSRFDWSLYMKIAAAVLFFVIAPGIIYYYQHLSPYMKSVTTDTHRKGPQTVTRPEVMAKGKSDEIVSKEISPLAEAETDQKKISDQRGAVSEPAVTEKDELTVSRSAPVTTTGESNRQKNIPDFVPIPPQVSPVSTPSADKDREMSRKVVAESAGQLELKSLAPRSSNEPAGSRPVQLGKSASEIPLETEEALNITPDRIAGEWVLNSDKRVVTITLLKSDEKYTYGISPQYPLICPVRISGQDTSSVTLFWQIPGHFPSSDQTRPVIIEDSIRSLSIRFGASALYRIDLSKNPTEARLVSQEK